MHANRLPPNPTNDEGSEVLAKALPKHLALLVVDDEPDVLDAIRRLFRKDYRLHLASSAAEALDLMAEQEVHLVMSDQRMPEMTGVEFLSQVRRHYPQAVRMLFTGYGGDIHAVIEAINQGHVYRYIHKPFDPAELKTVVAQGAERYRMAAEREQLLRTLASNNRLLERRNEDLAGAYQQLKTQDRLRRVAVEVLGHELNTPAAIILGYISLLKRRKIEMGSRVYDQAMDGIDNSGHRLRDIADKLTKIMLGDLSNLRLQCRTLAAKKLVEGIAQRLGPILSLRSQTLDIQETEPDLNLTCDPDLTHDILVNLIVNAIKFSPDGRTIAVMIEPDLLDGDRAVRFTVRDEGVGIDPEDRDQIFNTFFGTFRSHHHSSGDYGFQKRGLGLGLTIVKKFTELHGGRVDFESELGRGSVFRVLLPVQPKDSTDPRKDR